MSIGPSLIFDKSALQSFSADECMWLESFYLTNTTPLFFVETLADLEKEVRAGRKPEDVVGSIAHKTPDMACVNTHHRTLIAGELMQKGSIKMDGRPVISGSRTVELEGKMGVIFQEAPEVEASKRWEKKQFLEIERQIAKGWREELAVMGQENFEPFKKFFEAMGKPKTFEELKEKIELLFKDAKEEAFFEFGMSLMEIMPETRKNVIDLWKTNGSKPIREYAPYFSFIFFIDLFYHIGTAGKLFEQFPHPQTHKVDIAYLYYLPFCKIFTSNDRIHIRLAPVFMTPDQTFLSGQDLKDDFTKLNTHYDALPQEVKDRGTMVFAPCPPDDTSFLTTKMWDKYMATTWRSIKDHIRKFDGTDNIDPKIEEELFEKMKKFVKESKTVNSDKLPDSDEADSVMTHHMVSARKGKWNKFPPEVLKSNKRIFD